MNDYDLILVEIKHGITMFKMTIHLLFRSELLTLYNGLEFVTLLQPHYNLDGTFFAVLFQKN